MVKEVCERAGLNRVTFYRNLKNLNDVVTEIESNRLDQLRIHLASDKKHGEDLIREAITMLYGFMRQRKLTCIRALRACSGASKSK